MDFQMPEAIDQKEIDEIKEKYDRMIEANKGNTVAVLEYQSQCMIEISQTIRRQRDEAIAAGGELAEKIKAEDEELKKKAEEMLLQQYSKEELESLKKRAAEIKEEQERMKEEMAKKYAVKRNFCTNCGTKLKEGARFCTECGAKVE